MASGSIKERADGRYTVRWRTPGASRATHRSGVRRTCAPDTDTKNRAHPPTARSRRMTDEQMANLARTILWHYDGHKRKGLGSGDAMAEAVYDYLEHVALIDDNRIAAERAHESTSHS